MSKKPEQFSEEKKFNLIINVIKKKEFKNVVQYYKYWENNDIV